MCICSCVRVCQRIPLSYLKISAILVQLSMEINYFEIEARQVYYQYTPVSVFWAWEDSLLFPTKILVSCEPQEEYVRAKCQRAAQPYINPREIYVFMRVEVLKLIWRDLRQQFIMGTKYDLSWDFLWVSKFKILFGKHRIH